MLLCPPALVFHLRRTLPVALLCGAVVPLWAADAPAPGLQLVCGGIGQDESAQMLAATPKHALTLLFVARDGHYLSGVATKVDDPLGDKEAANGDCGPLAQVDVAKAGRYRVKASFGGQQWEQWLKLAPKAGAKRVIRFKAEE